MQARKLWAGSARSRLDFCTVHVAAAGPGQTYIVAQTAPGADAVSAAQAAYRAIARIVQERGLTIVHERLFGSLTARAGVLAARNAAFGAASLSPATPLSYIQGHPPWGQGLAGVIIRAVACRRPRDEVWTIRDQGQPVGRGWRQGGRHLYNPAKSPGTGPEWQWGRWTLPSGPAPDPAGGPGARGPRGFLP